MIVLDGLLRRDNYRVLLAVFRPSNRLRIGEIITSRFPCPQIYTVPGYLVITNYLNCDIITSGLDASKSAKNYNRRHPNRARSLPYQSTRASTKSPVLLNSSVCSRHDADDISTVKNQPLGNRADMRSSPVTKNDLVTEEFKERARPTRPISQSDAEADPGPPKSVRNPPHSCLKKTQRPSPSKFPLWNAFFSRKSHESQSRPSSAAGHYSEVSKHGRRNSVSSSLPRNRTGKLFRSISAGRVNDTSMTDGAMHGSSETIHRRVRWDPSSESPKEKRQSVIPAWNPRIHMVVQESSV